MSKQPNPQQKVSRDDIEDALRGFQGGVTDEIESRKQQVIMGVGLVVGLVIVLAFLVGKRRGKRKTTYVEIRRF